MKNLTIAVLVISLWAMGLCAWGAGEALRDKDGGKMLIEIGLFALNAFCFRVNLANLRKIRNRA